MGFKMRRSGMSLRSTTRIQPQLTNLQSNQGSPIHQDEIVGAEFNPTTYQETDSGVSGQRSSDGSSSLYGEISSGGKQMSDDKWIKFCEDNPCHRACHTQFGQCPETDGETQTGEGQLSVTTPETSGNMLTPREMRRNYRATDIFRRRQEDLIRRANKDYRQAIRRGETPPPGVMKILSGEYLGNMDGVNQGQASTGTTNLFTGQKTRKFNPKNGGSEKNLKAELNNELQKPEYAKMDPKEAIKKAEQIVSDAYIAGGKVNVYNPGQYLSKRSRNLSDNRGLTPDDFGDYGLKGRSQRKVDKDARRVTGYKEDLMKGVIENQNAKKDEPKYQYDPNNEDGMSKKEYDRLKRKITKRRGDNSAFKQKDSPINMTVNITKPSYKMGGFGSK
jgi:hypothetical protein